jgi:hypothetical protein
MSGNEVCFLNRNFPPNDYLTSVMKHILIPTDFTLGSLNVLRFGADAFDEELNITLLHFMEMPDSITDLLMLPRDTSVFNIISPEFREGVSLILNRYGSQIKRIRNDFFVGDGRRQFKNYLEHHKVDTIVFPENYALKMPSKRSYNPERLIWNTNWPVKYIQIPDTAIATLETGMAGLLLASA